MRAQQAAPLRNAFPRKYWSIEAEVSAGQGSEDDLSHLDKRPAQSSGASAVSAVDDYIGDFA